MVLRLSLTLLPASAPAPAAEMTPPPADLIAAPSSEPVALQASVLCHCLKVTQGEVADAIELHGCESIEHVTNACGAGGGCTACHRRIRALLNRR